MTENNSVTQFKNLPDEAGVRVRLAGAVLGCSAPTVWRLAKAGKITARKITNGITVFNVGSIRALLNGQK